MTAEQWLKTAFQKLSASGISSARLDALILLEDVTNKDRGWLLAHPEHRLQGLSLQRLDEKLERRAGHEPLAYIRKKCEFYGRQFYIDNRVLQPRPESEAMIELLKQLVDSKQLTINSQAAIADIGTGSGALAITAKLEFPAARVVAIDIDKKALAVAKKNSLLHKNDIDFFEGDLLKPLLTVGCKLSTILANLPYVPDSFTINQAAMNEPRQAIFGGKDGLDVYRRLFEQLSQLENRPLYVLTESLPPQHKKLTQIAKNTGYKLRQTEDFIQLFSL